nr:immunoglobulin light chain junction region [Macaca mulatta]MOX51777.1 immunoglobulin light chain junction region [Macaca mulatta]MOX52162.1 immunoglobulin light chain junction region [Macaca mulatta]MOX52934.1 immunoglobulin light chain junction region [Macaca mulatta]MOX53032.1 immunoglobulin light chain junction region [Macaca mulatta]
CMQGLELPFTF